MRTGIEQDGRKYVVKNREGLRLTLLGGNGPTVGEADLCVKGKAGEWRKPVTITGREGRELWVAEK